MKLPGHHLSKEGDYYFVVLDRMHSSPYLHEQIESALGHLYQPAQFMMAGTGNDALVNSSGNEHDNKDGGGEATTESSKDEINKCPDEQVPGISLTRPSPAREAREKNAAELQLLSHSNSEGSFHVIDDLADGHVMEERARHAGSRRASAPNTNNAAGESKSDNDSRRASFVVDNLPSPPAAAVVGTNSDTAAATSTQPPLHPILAKSKLAKLKLTSQTMTEKVPYSPVSDSPRSRNSSGDEIRRILHGAHSTGDMVVGRKFTSSPILPSPDRLKDISETGNELVSKPSRLRHSSGPKRHASGGSQASSINPSRPQTPRGTASMRMDASSRGSCTDQGTSAT